MKRHCVRNSLCAKLGEPQPAAPRRQMGVFSDPRARPLVAVMREEYPAVVMALSMQIMASSVTWATRTAMAWMPTVTQRTKPVVPFATRIARFLFVCCEAPARASPYLPPGMRDPG